MTSQDITFLHAPSVYDFRRESILYGPVSDMVPSTPVFEMYPIGFTTMAEYLERYGMSTRIVNLAVRMLQDPNFDVEKAISRMDSASFGIDLHWMPHAHGSIEIAKIVKRFHPRTPVIFGGFSSTYFHQELILYPSVDFVMRGDSTEYPMLLWARYIRSGGNIHPAAHTVEALELEKIPNLVWKDSEGGVHVNPISYSPESLDGIMLDYSGVLRSVVRYRNMADYIPFKAWKRYPITAALTVRGCQYNCLTCGGSCTAFKNLHNRKAPAYRKPEDLANDIRRIGSFSNGPIFILGDLRQAGDEYAYRFLDAISGYKKPLFIELFDAAPKEYFQRIARAVPNFVIEVSMESHDEKVRRAFGRPYSNAEIERSIDDALEAGCQRLDLFFMVGLKEQTYDSVMESVDYSQRMLKQFSSGGENRVIPFISPMAPFLDPGSRAFEQPHKHGYKLFAHTLEEHRQLLLQPSWKHVLNYETNWMNRHQIATATYEAGRRLNLIKAENGVISARTAEVTDARIHRAVELMERIDTIMLDPDAASRRAKLINLKHQVDHSNENTIADKRELETTIKGSRINFLNAAHVVVQEWWKDLVRSNPEPH